jgi:hypothetical protein
LIIIVEYFILQRVSLFDLLFILLLLTTFVTLLTAAGLAIRGRRAHAGGILRVWAICFAVYMAIVFVVALATPQRIVRLGEVRCFDDWCVAIQHADHAATPEGVAYSVTLQLSSRARGVTQRANGAYIYLTDAQGRQFDPAPDPSVIPMDVLLKPADAVEIRRSFTLPNDARDVGAVVVHEGSYCFPGCFIIGDGSILRKRAIVPLP